MKNKTLKYVAKSSEPFLLNKMKSEKANGFFKKGTFSNELIWGSYSYVSSHLTKTKQKSSSLKTAVLHTKHGVTKQNQIKCLNI